MAFVLIGFMGAGKSTAAGELAEALGGRVFDSDVLLAAKNDCLLSGVESAFEPNCRHVSPASVLVNTGKWPFTGSPISTPKVGPANWIASQNPAASGLVKMSLQVRQASVVL